ncbi:hypothetical protein SAMN05216350_10554 [Polaromonas sp. YR568]|uniref:hypothetical protein n=1 Tax=Polaromonas sp. YR568 TaxID=1855301 RepID=UPI0008F28EF0|nr:hypothetical protein [Polaromonas sp. YR568]SFU78046.1 hypothetical protein SAMN05216350_10554 [Polaromonas sp. YR568]
MTIFKFDLYRGLRLRQNDILEEAEALGRTLGVPDALKGRIGVSASNSSAPGPLRPAVVEALVRGSGDYVPLVQIGDDVRRVVKSVLGDGYDAAVVNGAEAGLATSYAALLAPSQVGAGDSARARVVVPYERHIEHHASYGRTVPGIYKDLFADRGATAGELGLLGRRLHNVDIALVKLAGARYPVHGIKSYPVPLLLNVDAEASAAALARAADVDAAQLAGFVALGYDTPGFGHGQKDADGTSVLHRRLGEVAAERGVPFVVDNAWGMPFLGTDLRRIGADVAFYSMDKVAGGPTAGLIIGREEPMVNIRRALGVHSERFGSVSAHGKASHVAFDPGKEALAGTLAALRVLRDEPRAILDPIDTTFAIVKEEFAKLSSGFKPGIQITRSVNAGGVEINYERTWDGLAEGSFGIPIFTHEDRIAQTNVLNNALARMGIVPNLSDDANILITPGAGTFNANGELDEERVRLVVRGQLLALKLIQDWGDRIAADA